MLALFFPFAAELQAFTERSSKGASSTAGTVPERLPLASGGEVLLAVSGQGKVATALACARLFARQPFDSALLIGAGGALDPALQKGDWVLGAEVLDADFAAERDGPGPGGAGLLWKSDTDWIHRLRGLERGGGTGRGEAVYVGRIATAERPVYGYEERLALGKRTGALAVGWEGAGFHAFLKAYGIAGAELRLITDVGEEGRAEGPPGREEIRALLLELKRGLPRLRRFLAGH